MADFVAAVLLVQVLTRTVKRCVNRAFREIACDRELGVPGTNVIIERCGTVIKWSKDGLVM